MTDQKSYLDLPITEFIIGKTRVKDIYVVDSKSKYPQIIINLRNSKNTQDAVAIINDENSEPVIGTIADVDIIDWVTKLLVDKKIETLENSTAEEIVSELNERREFFYVNEKGTLRDVINAMNKYRVNHVLVLNDELEYVGWVDKDKIINKVRRELLKKH